MGRIERITEMEAHLDRATAALHAYADALETYLAAQADVNALDRYYGGTEWRSDFEADEAGELPANLKRGVLSEDGVYDVLTENRALFLRTLETLAKIEQNRI